MPSVECSSPEPVTNKRTRSVRVLLANVASAGQRRRMLWSAALRLTELNAFDASTNRIPSVLGLSNPSRIAWTQVSQGDGIPTHNWEGATTSITSLSTTRMTALAMMRRWTSPTAMGRTPGRLSRAINRAAVNASRSLPPTLSVHILRAASASTLHSWSEAAA